jgi:hypothetical protein
MFRSLANSMSFGTLVIVLVTMTTEQQKRLLKAKVVVALPSKLGRVPKQEEIELLEQPIMSFAKGRF